MISENIKPEVDLGGKIFSKLYFNLYLYESSLVVGENKNLIYYLNI